MSAQHTPGLKRMHCAGRCKVGGIFDFDGALWSCRNCGWLKKPTNAEKAQRNKAEWCARCSVDVYVDGKCAAYGCEHRQSAAIAKATGSAAS